MLFIIHHPFAHPSTYFVPIKRSKKRCLQFLQFFSTHFARKRIIEIQKKAHKKTKKNRRETRGRRAQCCRSEIMPPAKLWWTTHVKRKRKFTIVSFYLCSFSIMKQTQNGQQCSGLTGQSSAKCGIIKFYTSASILPLSRPFWQARRIYKKKKEKGEGGRKNGANNNDTSSGINEMPEVVPPWYIIDTTPFAGGERKENDIGVCAVTESPIITKNNGKGGMKWLDVFFRECRCVCERTYGRRCTKKEPTHLTKKSNSYASFSFTRMYTYYL